ncbi:MAG: DUF4276 family protein [Planctomycetota bacterium]
MSSVLAIVEGHSERAFVERVLAPHLGLVGVALTARLIGPVGHKGGVRRPWPQVREEIIAMLRTGGGRRAVHVTTMFDYYGMPDDWPGREESVPKEHQAKATCVEASIHADICASLGQAFDPRLLFPYVQMHELEALLFVDIHKLRYEFVDEARTLTELASSVAGIPPEQINDSPVTAPSKRIIQHIHEYGRQGSCRPASPRLDRSPGTARRVPALRRLADPSRIAGAAELEALATPLAPCTNTTAPASSPNSTRFAAPGCGRRNA